MTQQIGRVTGGGGVWGGREEVKSCGRLREINLAKSLFGGKFNVTVPSRKPTPSWASAPAKDWVGERRTSRTNEIARILS